MDIADFFTTTSERRIGRLFRVLGWDAESARMLIRLTTRDGGLPTGAPTSPRLANIVNVRMDTRLSTLAAALGATYTRYADDLTFSFATDDRSRIHDVIAATKRILRQTGYRLHEHRKLEIRRPYEQQRVTGLVVNDRVNLPRRRRRWLRAVEHHLAVGRPATITPEQLAGWRALAAMVEGRTSGRPR
jgi:RNA-directed DNA polymerase